MIISYPATSQWVNQHRKKLANSIVSLSESDGNKAPTEMPTHLLQLLLKGLILVQLLTIFLLQHKQHSLLIYFFESSVRSPNALMIKYVVDCSGLFGCILRYHTLATRLHKGLVMHTRSGEGVCAGIVLRQVSADVCSVFCAVDGHLPNWNLNCVHSA